MRKHFNLTVSFLGVVIQSWTLLMILANAFVNVHAIQKSPLPSWQPWLLVGSSLLMICGLSLYAVAKGRTWLWGLLAVGLWPGWLLGVVILLFLPDEFTSDATQQTGFSEPRGNVSVSGR